MARQPVSRDLAERRESRPLLLSVCVRQQANDWHSLDLRENSIAAAVRDFALGGFSFISASEDAGRAIISQAECGTQGEDAQHEALGWITGTLRDSEWSDS